MAWGRKSTKIAAAFVLAHGAATCLGQNILAAAAPSTRPAGLPVGSHLVWFDEFTDNHLDRAKWRYEADRNKIGWYNGERQYYAAGRPENLRFERGHLIVEARREALSRASYQDWGGQAYTSARISTKGKAAWTFGFYEIRAKLPCTRGLWPAIWMLPETGDWPDAGEIDIMEQVGFAPEQIHATLHVSNRALAPPPMALSRSHYASCGKFHRFQLDWRPDEIIIGVDDRPYLTVDKLIGRSNAWPFDHPFHLILNLAVGGDWAGSRGIDDEALPQALEVDYVHVWKRP